MPRLCGRFAQLHKLSNSFPVSTGQDSCRRAVKIVDINQIGHFDLNTLDADNFYLCFGLSTAYVYEGRLEESLRFGYAAGLVS